MLLPKNTTPARAAARYLRASSQASYGSRSGCCLTPDSIEPMRLAMMGTYGPFLPLVLAQSSPTQWTSLTVRVIGSRPPRVEARVLPHLASRFEKVHDCVCDSTCGRSLASSRSPRPHNTIHAGYFSSPVRVWSSHERRRIPDSCPVCCRNSLSVGASSRRERLSSENHASTDIDCCKATSFGGGVHLQMHRSSFRAVWRPSGPGMVSRGPSHLILPVELHAGHATSSPSCATCLFSYSRVVGFAWTVPDAVVRSPSRIRYRVIA